MAELRAALREDLPEQARMKYMLGDEEGGGGGAKGFSLTLYGEDHEELCDLIEERLQIQNEITERWKSDNASDSWLASNVRPLIVLLLIGTLMLFIALDSLDLAFSVREAWISLYEVLTITAVGGYFTLRSVYDKRPRQ